MANMDPRLRDPSSRMPEKPRRPTSTLSPDQDDGLFNEFFDWTRYSTDFHQDPLSSSHPRSRHGSRSPRYLSSPGSSPRSSPRRESPRELAALIGEIPSLIRDHDVQGLESDFFRMDVMHRRHSRGDNASVSDYSGYSPPDLVRGGSTSPSSYSASGSFTLDPRDAVAHGYQTHSPPELIYGGSSPSSHSPSGSVVFDPRDIAAHHQDSRLGDFQAHDDKWTYPQEHRVHNVAPRGYSPSLQFESVASKTSGTKRRRSGEDLSKRPRHLADPHQTAVVRKTGACLPCRVSKTKCDDRGVCPKCRNDFKDFSDRHLVCIRSTPVMMWPVIGKLPNIWTQYAVEEERLWFEPQLFFGKTQDLFVFFPNHSNVAPLHTVIQAYRTHDGYGDGAPRAAAIPREWVPSHAAMQAWVEGLIENRRKGDFQHMVELLLMTYAREGHHLPKHGLVSKVHSMNCFFKIWKARAFVCNQDTKMAVPPTVQAQLRNIARSALNSLEHDILKELDDCVTQQGKPKDQERLAIWMSLWQLMLMYREILNQFGQHLDILARQTRDMALVSEQERWYRRVRDQFFPLLAVFYHYQFRTKKSLDFLEDWVKPGQKSSCDVPNVRRCAQQLLELRKDTYHSFQRSSNEMDRQLCTFVINHELKKLNARKRKPVTKSRSGYVYDDDDGDD